MRLVLQGHTKCPCKNNLKFWGKLSLTPALSHRMGEGESSAVGRRIQPFWELRETALAVPSPVGRERVRVRDFFFERPHFIAQTLNSPFQKGLGSRLVRSEQLGLFD